MQGKERKSGMIDPQFTDQAWSNMSNLLDKEMPVEAIPVSDNKRKYGLLLLVLIIGFASGVGMMTLLQDENQYVPKPDSVQHSTVDPLKVADAGILSDEVKTYTTMAGETNQLAITNQINKGIEQKIQVSNSKTTYNNSEDQNLDKNASSKVVVNTNQSKVELLDVPFSPLNNSTVENKLKAVPLLNSPEVDFLNIPQNNNQFDLITIPAQPKLSLGVYASSLTRDFGGMHGWSAGFRASYALDNRFSIRTGLGYSIISGFQTESLGITEPLTPAYFEPIEADLQNYSTVSSLENNQDLPIQSLQYLDLPVGLNYKMSEKISILMGAKFSYLVNATTDGYVVESLDQEEERLLDQAMYNSMRKVDFGTVLGFGFYPTKSIGVELKYNHGFVDYTIDEKWHIRQLNSNKTFELGLNYLFK